MIIKNIQLPQAYAPQDLHVIYDHQQIKLVNQQQQVLLDLTSQLDAQLFVNRNSFPAVYDAEKKELQIIRFIELQGKTSKSLLDSVVRVQELTRQVPLSVAVNEHGNMYSLSDFGTLMHQAQKKPIFGAELYVHSMPQVYRVQQNDTVSMIAQLMQVEIAQLKADNPSIAALQDNDVVTQPTLKIAEAQQANHLVLLAKNKTGYQNLMYLVSYGQIHQEFGYPQLPWTEILQHRQGLIALSGSEDSEIYRALLQGDQKHAQIVLRVLQKYFQDDFYVEVFHKGDNYTTAVQTVYQLAHALHLKTVAVNDFHMLSAEQAFELKALQTIATKKTITQNFNTLPGDQYYVHSSTAMEQEWQDDLASVDRTIEIYEKIADLDILPHKLFTPAFPIPQGYHDQNEYFEFLSRKGFKLRMQALQLTPQQYQEYQQRLDYEISIIEKMGYAGYFLIVADFVNYAKRNYELYDEKTANRWRHFAKSHGYSVNKPIAIGFGRGSAAGSLVSYCLHITEVNPLPYGLLFERFLNTSRAGMPDIDTDIPDNKRPEVVEYVTDFYNQGNQDELSSRVAGIVTFTVLHGKQVLRDVTRISGLPPSVGDKLSAAINKATKALGLRPTPGASIKQALTTDDFQKLYHSTPEITQVVDLASKLEDLEKSDSQHAAGKIITPTPVIDYLPVSYMKIKGTNDFGIVAQVTNVEDFGLLKMDFLGLRSMGVVDSALGMINAQIKQQNQTQQTHVPYIEPLTVLNQAIHDINLYKFLSAGNTYGIFQFGKAGITKLVADLMQDIDHLPANEQTGAELFRRLAAAAALYRPGPMQFIDDYVHNMQHQQKNYNTFDLSQPVPALEADLAETYGVPVYQEEVMQITRDLAGFSLNDADNVRKAMGHKIRKIMDEYQEYFIHGSQEKQIPGAIKKSHLTEADAVKIWQALEKFASYGFNKSHTIAYTYLSIVDTWLSYYYPHEFFAATLNSFQGSDKANKIAAGLSQAKMRHIAILPASVNESQELFTPTSQGVRFGLFGIKNMGTKGKLIIAERKANGPFTNLLSFIVRMKTNQSFGKQMFESLVYSGTLDEFAGSRSSKLAKEDQILDFADALKKDELANIHSLFTIRSQANLLKTSFTFSDTEQLDATTRLLKEKEYTGSFVTGHPVDKYDYLIKNNAAFAKLGPYVLTNDAVPTPAAAQTFLVVVDSLETFMTKATAEEMATLQVEDNTGSIAVTVFPGTFTEAKQLLHENALVAIVGKIEDSDNYGLQLIAQTITAIDDVLIKQAPQKVCVTLAADSQTAAQQLQQILQFKEQLPATVKYPSYPLFYQLGTHGRWFKRTKQQAQLSLSIDPATSHAVQQLIGKDNLQLQW